MTKVLGLALYGPLAASTRYRLSQYIPGLAAYGIDLQVRYLLNNDYLSRTFRGESKPWPSMIGSGCRRLVDLAGQFRYDAIMLHCELFPLMPAWLEGFLLQRPYLYDFDDAFYLKYRSGRLARFERILGEKFDAVIGSAAAVTAGSHALQDHALKHNPRTTLLPTVVDTSRYVPVLRERAGELVVGWIGSPSTARYLSLAAKSLSDLGKEGPVRLVVIGGKAPPIKHVTIVELDWKEETEVDLIRNFDVGIMPLPDDEWARGKCAFKLIQYMACSIPVVASPVGANVEVVRPECGLLATTDSDWLDALRFLRDRPKEARAMGRAGRERVEREYSLGGNLPLLAEALDAVARSG